jgi:hypothetical protein
MGRWRSLLERFGIADRLWQIGSWVLWIFGAIISGAAGMIAWASSTWDWYWATFQWAGAAFAFLVAWISLSLGLFFIAQAIRAWNLRSVELRPQKDANKQAAPKPLPPNHGGTPPRHASPTQEDLLSDLYLLDADIPKLAERADEHYKLAKEFLTIMPSGEDDDNWDRLYCLQRNMQDVRDQISDIYNRHMPDRSFDTKPKLADRRDFHLPIFDNVPARKATEYKGMFLRTVLAMEKIELLKHSIDDTKKRTQTLLELKRYDR